MNTHFRNEPADAQVRREQAAFGRQHAPGPRQGGSGNKPFKAKGHDIQLQDAQNSGHRVYLRLLDSDPGFYEEGVIVRRDAYTITFRSDKGQFAGVPRIIYKHAIAELAIIPAVNAIQ